VNSFTAYDVLSVSLGAGEWLLWAQAVMHNTVASAIGAWLQLLQVTGSVVLSDSSIAIPLANRPSLDCSARVVLAGTDTIKLQAVASLGSSQLVIRRDVAGLTSPTNVGTRLLALKVA